MFNVVRAPAPIDPSIAIAEAAARVQAHVDKINRAEAVYRQMPDSSLAKLWDHREAYIHKEFHVALIRKEMERRGLKRVGKF